MTFDSLSAIEFKYLKKKKKKLRGELFIDGSTRVVDYTVKCKV
jgi:hypothetical protein